MIIADKLHTLIHTKDDYTQLVIMVDDLRRQKYDKASDKSIKVMERLIAFGFAENELNNADMLHSMLSGYINSTQALNLRLSFLPSDDFIQRLYKKAVFSFGHERFYIDYEYVFKLGGGYEISFNGKYVNKTFLHELKRLFEKKELVSIISNKLDIEVI